MDMKRNILLTAAAAALAFAPAAFGDDSTMSVAVGPEATFTALNATTTMSKGNTTFGNFAGTSSFTYKIRTTLVGGTGSITVALTVFSSGGPALTDLAYTCTAPSSGTPCSTSTPITAAATPTTVVSFGTDAHSADVGDSGTAVWSLVDRPQIQTGTYTATATFTISAT